MNTDNKPCYETAEANLFTRYETGGGQGTFALPYSGLLFAHQAPTPAGGTLETITLVYVTHTVLIRGTQLSPLLLVMQKGRAETVRVGGGQPSGATTTPSVREITVTEGAKPMQDTIS